MEPPKRDMGIAHEREWNIKLGEQAPEKSEFGLQGGNTWWRKSGEECGPNGYRCRWTVMGGATEGTEWKETWWEKADWSGLKELGAEKSGFNAAGDTWWETWRETYTQDAWSGIAQIEKSASKWAHDSEGREWHEKWWEKYDAKGWAEKGADKSGRDGEQAWWEKWGEQYDGRGRAVKWTDKWAESIRAKAKWGDKWEERFENDGTGSKQGETWQLSPEGERWSRTWGEAHARGELKKVGPRGFWARRQVRKYGRSTSGEAWDATVAEDGYVGTAPPFGWAEAVANSLQLLSIESPQRSPEEPWEPPAPPGAGDVRPGPPDDLRPDDGAA